MTSDPRHLSLQLLRLCKQFEVLSLAQNTALGAIVNMDRDLRAGLSGKRVSEMVQEAKPSAQLIADQEYAELEQALAGGSDFRLALQVLLDKHQ